MNSVEVASYVSLTLFDGKSCWGGADVTNWFVGGSVLHPETSRRDGGWVGLQVCGAMVVGLEGRPAIKREPYERLVLESAVDLGCCFDRDRKSRRGRQRYQPLQFAIRCPHGFGLDFRGLEGGWRGVAGLVARGAATFP